MSAITANVALGMPRYGPCHAGALRAFYWKSSRTPGVKQAVIEAETSLLACTFNGLWCEALNLLDQGWPISHFAMLHADVEPDDWWLDTLLAEMHRTGAELISAVVAIKDNRGLTSTAIDDPADPFCPLRRLTMQEVFALPETFGSAEVGYPDRALLVNTGCWVCKFDPSWVYDHTFTVRDRKVKGPLGWKPQSEPEDWAFSRWLHARGKKVLATRKVNTTHHGTARYRSHEPWGLWEHDDGVTTLPVAG